MIRTRKSSSIHRTEERVTYVDLDEHGRVSVKVTQERSHWTASKDPRDPVDNLGLWQPPKIVLPATANSPAGCTLTIDEWEKIKAAVEEGLRDHRALYGETRE